MYIFKTDPRHDNPNYQYSPEEIAEYIEKFKKYVKMEPKLIVLLKRLDDEYEKAKEREALKKKYDLI